MGGALIMVFVILLVGPVLVFAGGAAWSAGLGWLLDVNARERASGADGANGA